MKHKVLITFDRVNNTNKYYWIVKVDDTYFQSVYFTIPNRVGLFNQYKEFVYKQIPERYIESVIETGFSISMLKRMVKLMKQVYE